MRAPLVGLMVLATTLAQEPNPADWYSKYPHYPDYCSIPSAMENRQIPPLPSDGQWGESRLKHVSVIIRHGARTPTRPDLTCWSGYHDAPETSVWNCNLTTWMVLPTPFDGSSASPAFFEKHYDGLMHTSLANELNGTCQRGQLLWQGYDQEMTNGKHLRDAYVYNSKNYDHDTRLRLLDTHSPLTPHLYFRVDDDQRTVMSGQVLLQGMLGSDLTANLPLHIADRDNDIMDPNEYVCPRLREMRERFERSQQYQQYMNSKEVVTLRAFMKDVLGINGDMDAIDCLMTAMCTDRPIPDSIDDFDPDWQARRLQNFTEDHVEGNTTGAFVDEPVTTPVVDYGNHLFQRLFQFDSDMWTMVYSADNAAYAKLGMAWLWADILKHIRGFFYETEDPSIKKFALYSGHDTTIMPILVSLGPDVWDHKWAPYASMIVIELHEINIDGHADKDIFQSNFAFRLIYNGQVLTHLMDGCPNDSELCDAQVFLTTVGEFATPTPECRRRFPIPTVYEDTVSRAREFFATPGGIVALLMLVAASATVGALGSFFCLTGGLSRKRHRRSQVPTDEHDGLTIENGDYENGYTDNPTFTID